MGIQKFYGLEISQFFIMYATIFEQFMVPFHFYYYYYYITIIIVFISV